MFKDFNEKSYRYQKLSINYDENKKLLDDFLGSLV